MEYRGLDITVISATDLKNVNMLMRMGVFVEAYVSGDKEELLTRKRKTHVDTNGGCHPEWNYRFKFTVEETCIFKSFINFHLKAERGFFDRAVGEVRIPLRDLLQDCINNQNRTSHQDIEAEYQVLTKGRKAKGSLKISFRFGDIFVDNNIDDAAAAAAAVVTPNNTTSIVAFTPHVDHHIYPPQVDIYPPPPYELHSQPGQYSVPPGYGYPAAAAAAQGGGYMYHDHQYQYPPPPPLTYYPQPPPPLGGYNGQTYAYMPAAVQQHDEKTLVKVKKKRSGFGSNMGLLGLGLGLIGGLLFRQVVSEAAAAAGDSGDGDTVDDNS